MSYDIPFCDGISGIDFIIAKGLIIDFENWEINKIYIFSHTWKEFCDYFQFLKILFYKVQTVFIKVCSYLLCDSFVMYANQKIKQLQIVYLEEFFE